jgi:hypothetical protein
MKLTEFLIETPRQNVVPSSVIRMLETGEFSSATCAGD